MASTADIAKTAPETLPADFSEWDGGAPPATLPASSNGFEAAPDPDPAPPKPPAQAVRPRVGMPPVVNRIRSAPALTPATAYADAEAIFQPLRSNGVSMGGIKRRTDESEDEDKGANKKKLLMAAIPVGAILLVLVLIPVIYPRFMTKTAMAKQTAVSRPVTATGAAPQSPSQPQQLTSTKVTLPPPPADANANTDPVPAPAPHVDSAMMKTQLTAPTRIQRDTNEVAANDAPVAGFGSTGMDGLGDSANGAVGSVFNGQSRSKVKVESSRPMVISAGVAVGLLVQRTAPIYPEIAKTARVSGTVVLQATITKTGALQGVHVVSGPDMLRQAALDAVRSWRYKPYKLNNEPVDVETSVNVVFALGG